MNISINLPVNKDHLSMRISFEYSFLTGLMSMVVILPATGRDMQLMNDLKFNADINIVVVLMFKC